MSRAKVARTRGGHKLRVDMRGHSCSPVKVRIQLTLAGARKVTVNRTFRTCVARR